MIDQIPETFTALGEQFFSLGQSREYYEILMTLDGARDEIPAGLRDVVNDLDILNKYLHGNPGVII